MKVLESTPVDKKEPTTFLAKVSDCQICGQTIHQYLNSVGQSVNMPWSKFMEKCPEDPRIPLMKAMHEMDKQFQIKLNVIIGLKSTNDNKIKELTRKYADEFILDGEKTIFSFKKRKIYKNFLERLIGKGKYVNPHDEYSDKLIEINNEFNEQINKFTNSEVEITPIYPTRLPDFKLFPDKPELRDPLKRFILE